MNWIANRATLADVFRCSVMDIEYVVPAQEINQMIEMMMLQQEYGEEARHSNPSD